MPGVYWPPFYRTIAQAQLGKIAEVEKEVKDLLTVRPDFATRGHHLLSIMVMDSLLREHVIEGPERAGPPLVRQIHLLLRPGPLGGLNSRNSCTS